MDFVPTNMQHKFIFQGGNKQQYNTMACKNLEIDFIVQDDNPEMASVEGDIVANLEKIGIQVNTKFLNNTEYRDAEVNGDYHLLFTRSWGAPYDPHSYMASWGVPSHVEYSAIGNLQVRGVLVDGYLYYVHLLLLSPTCTH
jgi:nickel transport system substrate-binding protein